MKVNFIICLLLISGFTKAQNDTLNKPIEFSAIVKVDSTLKADELYRRAKRWFGDYFKSGKDVIQIDDKDNYEIVGKGWMPAPVEAIGGAIQNSGKIWFKVNIYCKQGRYRYVINDFVHEGEKAVKYPWPDIGLLTASPNPPDFYLEFCGPKLKAKLWQNLKDDALSNSQVLIASLTKAMELSSPTDNW